YFVMEYVDGKRLDEYCRENQLPIRERLELFRKICAAVSYAHKHLIIHRDIKPANIRVTPDGEPKLLDFGIARLLDPQTSTIAEATMTFAAVMTPEYASPEQVRGEAMTTASDVYSLGVLLYELLTGQKPYKIANRSPTALTQAITTHEPTRPSTAVRENQSSEIRSELLRGDIDNIVLKALRKEPERRYTSVSQFSDDIRRHLEGHPVIARKDTFNYRASKFIRRNKIGVAAAAVIFLTLIGGMVATGWEAHRANRRFNDVRRLANSLMFEIHDSVKDLQGSTPTRRLIVSRALEYLDSLAHDAGNNIALQRELATAYEKIGDIQGNPYSANLGDTNGALASHRKALAIREKLSTRRTSTELQMELGRSYRALGDILEQKGEIAETVRDYRQSLSIFEKLVAAQPADFSVQDEFARAYEVLGDGLGRMANNSTERSEAYRKSLSIRQDLLAQKSSDGKLRRSVALTFLKVGATLEAKNPEAVGNIKRGIEMLEGLSQEDPNNERARREVGYAYYQLGNTLLQKGDFSAALDARRKAFAIRQEIAAEDPKNVQAQFDLAVAYGDLAEALSATGDNESALERARQSLSMMQALAKNDPSNAVYQRNVGLCYERLAEIRARLANDDKHSVAQRVSDWTEARNWYRRGAELFSALRDQGTLMPIDSDRPQKFSARVQECDNAIAALK
ncbi:MAG TPA: protein kinase, partial [Chthoniobacterales bacterium]|nr:protein kinase [Chthoniobacterales bacterium]